MKILLVTSTLLMGGTERYILNFVKNLKKMRLILPFAAGELLLERIEHPEMPVRRVIFPPTRVSGNSVADC